MRDQTQLLEEHTGNALACQFKRDRMNDANNDDNDGEDGEDGEDDTG